MDANHEDTLSLKNILDLYVLDRTPSEETINLLEKIIRIFSKDMGIATPKEINKHILNLWKHKLLSRISGISCNSYLRQLKSLILFAFEENIIEDNPFDRFRMAKEEEKPFKSITQDHVIKLIDYLNSECNTLQPGWFWITVIKTFYYTGIRRRQLVGLKWADINFTKNKILLKSKYSKTLHEWEIPLHEDIYDDLVLLQKKNHERYGANLKEIQVFNITLFNQRYKENNMTSEHISNFFKKISLKTKVKGSAHRFRHRLATDLCNQGRNIKDVQLLLGHQNVNTTLGYVNTNLEQIRKTLSSTTPIYVLK